MYKFNTGMKTLAIENKYTQVCTVQLLMACYMPQVVAFVHDNKFIVQKK